MRPWTRRRIAKRLALLPLAAPAIVRAKPGAPMRVVCVGGAVTECAFALGSGARVIAVDSTSQFPAAAGALPRIGYMRNLPPEGIVSLRPDLVLASADAGPEAAIAVLRAAGMRLVRVPDGTGPEAVLAKIAAVADAFGVGDEPLRSAFRADAALLDAPLAGRPRARALFVLSVSRGAPLVSGRDTAADAMLAWSGARNAIDGFAGYRALSGEAALLAAPEVIVTMAHSLRDAGGIAAMLALPQLAHTPAARARRVLALDGSYAIGWGPRAAHARHDLAVGFGHAGLPAMPARPWV